MVETAKNDVIYVKLFQPRILGALVLGMLARDGAFDRADVGVKPGHHLAAGSPVAAPQTRQPDIFSAGKTKRIRPVVRRLSPRAVQIVGRAA